jgi:putative transposase
MPKGKRHTEEQIIGILKQADAGVPIPDLCRQYGISNATLYKWRSKFGGMDVSDAKRLKGLEGENTKLKHIVADLTLDNKVLKELLSKKF